MNLKFRNDRNRNDAGMCFQLSLPQATGIDALPASSFIAGLRGAGAANPIDGDSGDGVNGLW